MKYLQLRMIDHLFSNPHGYHLFYDKHVKISDPIEYHQVCTALIYDMNCKHVNYNGVPLYMNCKHVKYNRVPLYMNCKHVKYGRVPLYMNC